MDSKTCVLNIINNFSKVAGPTLNMSQTGSLLLGTLKWLNITHVESIKVILEV